MTRELVISADRHETKVAMLEDDQLVELYFQRANEYSLAGSIHKGRVTRVLPGMQSAFVDLGLERDTFLYVSDFFEESDEYERIPEQENGHPRERGDRGARGRDRSESRESRADAQTQTVAPAPEPAAPPQITEPAAAEPAPPPSEPISERQPERVSDRGENGDRRGRRSRRRRNRGRGFPESKYADVGGPEERVPAHEERLPAVSVPGGADFAVLPGESLAKYAAKPLEAEEQEEIAEAQAIGARPPERQLEAPTEFAPPEELETTDALPAGHPAVLEGDAAEPTQDDEPLPADGDIGELASGAEAENPVSIEDTEAAIEESAPADVSAAGTAEALETQSSEAPSGQLTATVRDHGGRYPHRLSRRMRRRMRGGEEHAAQTAPAAALPTAPKPDQRTVSRSERAAAAAAQPSITELLREGQEIIVQIAKEPLGQKGARITSHIALPGRYVVYMPTVEHIGVSRKIDSDEERQRLRRILQTHRAGVPGGYIVRTAGAGHTEDEIAADMNFLFNLWLDIRQKAEKKPAPALLHHDLDIVQRTLRDQLTEEFKAVWVDNEEVYESIINFVQRFQPALVNRVKLYTREAPIFEAFNITSELEKALRPKVWLKSGGYIVLNQTEALVAIDVNTGKYVGKSNRLEDTIVKTNTDAVREIVRQIRLRDLGGIIVVDFIDMDERRNRQKVMQALEEAMRADRAPYKILSFNDFGLVAITRKRVRQSLERTLCSPCPYCEGAGYVKSVSTVIGEILQEARKLAKAMDSSDVMLRVHPDVARVLKSNSNQYLEELEAILRRPVLVKGDPQIHHEKFDLG